MMNLFSVWLCHYDDNDLLALLSNIFVHLQRFLQLHSDHSLVSHCVLAHASMMPLKEFTMEFKSNPIKIQFINVYIK